jgi:hypothetical protein
MVKTVPLYNKVIAKAEEKWYNRDNIVDRYVPLHLGETDDILDL